MPPRLRLLACAALLAACDDPEPDALDPAVVDAVAKSEGDADGDARSGFYALTTTESRTCDCPELQGFDLCSVNFAQIGGGSASEFVQYDGYLLFSPDSETPMSGRVDDDGSFDLGGLGDLDTLFTAGEMVTRLTGEFSGDTLTAVLRTRFDGTILEEPVHCRTEVELAGTRLQVP